MPVQIQSAQRWVGLAFGDAHGAGVTANGRVFTWGDNSVRQLGQDAPPTAADQPTELAVLHGLDIKLLACGAQVSTLLQLHLVGNTLMHCGER